MMTDDELRGKTKEFKLLVFFKIEPLKFSGCICCTEVGLRTLSMRHFDAQIA